MTRLLNPNDLNVVMLELVARRLGPDLCSRFAFVGGAVAGLLITDPANPPIRSTEDVDIVAEVLALSGYHRIEKALRERGFAQDISADAPICRWQVEGVTVDVMPTMEEILGLPTAGIHCVYRPPSRWHCPAVFPSVSFKQRCLLAPNWRPFTGAAGRLLVQSRSGRHPLRGGWARQLGK